jgi:hypothetical protein
MSALQRAAEVEIYFKANWTATSYSYTRQLHHRLSNNNLDKYIMLDVINDGSNSSWFKLFRGRITHTLRSLVIIKSKKLCIGLSDDIKTFFDNKELPYDIRVKDGQQGITVRLESGYFATTVIFRVEQY